MPHFSAAISWLCGSSSANTAAKLTVLAGHSLLGGEAPSRSSSASNVTWVQVCYIREKAEKGAPDGICCAEGSVRFRTQMSENSRLESIKGVTELKSNKPAKVKSTFEAINFFKKIVKFVP